MHLYLDIETIPSQAPGAREACAGRISPPGSMKKAETIAAWERDEKPVLVEEAWRRTALDGSLGHVISIAYALDDGEVGGVGPGRVDRHWTAVPFGGADGETWRPDYASWLGIEAERLDMAFRGMEERLQADAPPTVVAHHADFDVRFLYHRAVILGVRLPTWWPVNERIGGDRVYCTMQAWAGYRERIGLDRLCRALGIPGKDGLDGAGVYDAWLSGEEGCERIWRYNSGDVQRVRSVHRRLTGLDIDHDVVMRARLAEHTGRAA